MGRGGVGASRSEFLSEESVDDIRYNRNGGCFVSTKRAMAFMVLAVVSLVIVIILMYYYGPNRQMNELQEEVKDIEQLINNTINEESVENIRLPNHLVPIHYRLKIHPILDEYSRDNFTYTGQVKILIHCDTKTSRIVLNVDDIDVKESHVTVTTQKVRLVGESLKQEEDEVESTEISRQQQNATSAEKSPAAEGGDDVLLKSEMKVLMVQEVYREQGDQKLIIVMRDLLENGHNYTVDIKFAGNITKNFDGLYRTSYTDLAGDKRWLATTFFHPIFARRVFPCFDEPNFKASFDISIARRTNMTALTNMPLRETEEMPNGDGWVWDHFERSLPMSTYLVSFTICDFKNMRSESNGAGPVINIWAPEADLERAQYALDASQDILHYLEEYFDVNYPLPKIDLLAIPNFARGALGSWGILSFRKSSLLLDKNSKSWEMKQHIFITLAHELAHQWFGNLVTMKWWTDLWLNEGIGSFVAEVVQKNLKPKWQTSNDFPLRIMYKSFMLDTLKSTHSIQTELTKNGQIEQIFDTVIQSKGTSLIRMLNYTLSRPVFRQGLQQYLKDLSYKSTDTETLWNSLTQIAQNYKVLPEDVTVKSFMESWTKQKGYPYVTVNRNYETGQAVITQKIMIQDNINNESLWYIPLSYTSTDDIIKTVWMKNERNITLDIEAPGWVLFNIDQAGYFRVNYDTQNWKLLNQQLQKDPTDIQIASRGQLLNDAFELAKLEIINYTIPFELTKYLRVKESNYVPWFAALDSLEELIFTINNYEYTGAYETFITNLIKVQFHALGTKEKSDEHPNDRILRWRLLELACQLRYEPCIRWASNEYEKWMAVDDPDKDNPIPFEYRYAVQCTSIKTGNRREWDFLWNRTQSSLTSPADQQTMYLSLGCTHDPWLINKYLELSLEGNITIENIPYVWESINHPVGIRTGFHFLRLNWDRIYDTYEDVYLVLSSICQDFLANLSTEIDLQDLTQFFKENQKDLKSLATLIQGAVDAIKLRISWKEKHLESVVNWLKKENKKSNSLLSYL